MGGLLLDVSPGDGLVAETLLGSSISNQICYCASIEKLCASQLPLPMQILNSLNHSMIFVLQMTGKTSCTVEKNFVMEQIGAKDEVYQKLQKIEDSSTYISKLGASNYD